MTANFADALVQPSPSHSLTVGEHGLATASSDGATTDVSVATTSYAATQSESPVDVTTLDADTHFAECVVCPWEGADHSVHFFAVIDAAEHTAAAHRTQPVTA